MLWLNSLNEVPTLYSQWGSGLTMSMLIILRSICKHLPDYRDWYRDGVYQNFVFFVNFIILWTSWKFSKYAVMRVSEHYSLDLKQISLCIIPLNYLKEIDTA